MTWSHSSSSSTVLVLRLIMRLTVMSSVASSLVAAKACKPGQASSSGVIQLTQSSCLPNAVSSDGRIDINSLQATCGPAFKVDVNSKGHIYMTPLEQGAFKWAGPGPYNCPAPKSKSAAFNCGLFQCKDMNATGLFDAHNKRLASMMFYNDVGKAHSRLVVTGPNKLTLVAANTVGYKVPQPNCTHNFTVVSGCVMGIQPSKTYSCPSGWYTKTNTKYRIKYCAPCPLGTSSSGPGATKCTPCPAGYEGKSLGGKCTKCEGSTYSSKPGASQCDDCNVNEWQFDPKAPRRYTDGKSCKICPNDSWAHDNSPSQCVACSNGVKCCRTNPSKECPPCKPGFKSAPATAPATFALTSASPAACLKTDSALCSTSFTVKVLPTCLVDYKVHTTASADILCDIPDGSASILKHKASITDVTLFQFFYGSATIASIKGPFVTYKLQADPDSATVPKTCLLTYRSISSTGAQLGVSAAPCPAGSSGCVSKAKKCPAGSYLTNNIGGNTLCLPCPPGSYTSAGNAATKCTPCSAGKYTSAYGSTSCSSCPVGMYSKKGSTRCTACSSYEPPPGRPGSTSGYYSTKLGSSECLPCPANSVPQGSVTLNDPGRVTRCIGQSSGVLCCAAGDCAGQKACPAKLQPYSAINSAILQLQTLQISDPSCRNATFVKCLSPKGLLAVKSPEGPNSIVMDAYGNQPGCTIKDGSGFTYTPSLFGAYVAANRARFEEGDSQILKTYEAVFHPSSGTVKMYYMPGDKTPNPINPATVKCSATFKLIAGYAFDLKPPTGAKCPAGSIPTNQNGLVSCQICDFGNVVKQGKCRECPAGTFQSMLGGTQCIPCASGTQNSFTASSTCSVCDSGSIPSRSKTTCESCPANTYAVRSTLKCNACPEGLVAPVSSSTCGVPFPTK